MHRRITHLEREIEELKYQEHSIKKEVDKINRELVDKTPEHFSQKDVVRSFIGSIFLAFSVAFSSNILNIARAIPAMHIWLVILFTIIMLTSEIYFVGYQRVENKVTRRFGQFWIKRILAFYIVAVIVSFMIAYIFGLVYLVDDAGHFFKIIMIISGPASIGASIGDLLKKY